MKKIIRNVIIIIYAIIAITVTICLLSFNDYKISEFGEYSLIIIDDNELSSNYSKGDLVITDKNSKVEEGDEVFFYNTYAKEITVTLGTVTNIEKITDKEYTYTLEGSTQLSSEYVLGTSESTTKIAVLGTILGILESKWGFLILIVLPTLVAFLYEIWEVISEVRGKSKKKGSK